MSAAKHPPSDDRCRQKPFGIDCFGRRSSRAGLGEELAAYQAHFVEVYAFNDASLRLHQWPRFREEGRLRRMLYTEGRYHDEVTLGMTAEEWSVDCP